MLIKTLKFVFGINAVLFAVPLAYVFAVGYLFGPTELPEHKGDREFVHYAQVKEYVSNTSNDRV